MTSPLPRRALAALPLLLVTVLMTACSSTGTSPGASAGTGSSAPAEASAAPVAGSGVYEKYTKGAQLCALVPLSEVSAAMKVTTSYPAGKATDSPLECTYSNHDSMTNIVSVAWSPAGDGMLDDQIKLDPKTKPTAIDVGGRPGRTLNGDVQVVVGDAAIDVFGIGKPDPSRYAALAAAFAKKVE